MASDSAEAGSFTVGLAAATGGIAAVFVDLLQKGDASAVFKLTGLLNQFGHMVVQDWPDFPVLGIGLALVVFGIVLAFISNAQSRNAAFFSGASVISVIMTLVPYEAPLPPQSGTTVNKTSWNEGWQGAAGARLMPAVYIPGADARFHYVAAGQLPVTIVVHLPAREGAKPEAPARIDGRLFDAVSGKQWQIGFADPDPSTQTNGKEIVYRFDLAIETGTAQGNTVADLKLRVKARGYAVGQARLVVTTPGLPVTMEVTLEPSSVPKGLEGLGRIFERPSF